MKVVALSGGVGGAKLAHGLYQALEPDMLTLIVNTGDDFDHYGLRICPDLDTALYTLAGIANEATGWGVAQETPVVVPPSMVLRMFVAPFSVLPTIQPVDPLAMAMAL